MTENVQVFVDGVKTIKDSSQRGTKTRPWVLTFTDTMLIMVYRVLTVGQSTIVIKNMQDKENNVEFDLESDGKEHMELVFLSKPGTYEFYIKKEDDVPIDYSMNIFYC